MPRQAASNETATINANKHQQCHTTGLTPIDQLQWKSASTKQTTKLFKCYSHIQKLQRFTLSILNNLLTDRTLTANNKLLILMLQLPKYY